MAIFFSVATLTEPSDGHYYAVLRIDTDKFVGDGCEAAVESLHVTYPEAEAASDRATAALASEASGN